MRLAFAKQHVGVVKSILKANIAMMMKTGQCGKTALSWSIMIGDTQQVKILLENGANIAFRDEDGDTLLHTAVHSGSSEIVNILLEAGLKDNRRDDHGGTAYNLALILGPAKIQQMLSPAEGVEVEEWDSDSITDED